MAYNPRIATQYLPVRGMDKALAFMNSEYLQAVVDVPLGLVFGTKPRIMRPPHFDKNVELPMVFSKLVEQLGREAFPYLITCGFVAYRIVNDVPQIVNLNNGRVTLSITKKLEILLHFTWNRVTADMISTRKYIANTLVANSDPKVHFFVLKYPTNRGELQSAMVPAIDLLERIHVLRKLELEQERRRTYPPMRYKYSLPPPNEEGYKVLENHLSNITGGSRPGVRYIEEMGAQHTSVHMVDPAYRDQYSLVWDGFDAGQLYEIRHSKRNTGDIIVGELVTVDPVQLPKGGSEIVAQYSKNLEQFVRSILGLHGQGETTMRMEKQVRLVILSQRATIQGFAVILENCLTAIMNDPTYTAFADVVSTMSSAGSSPDSGPGNSTLPPPLAEEAVMVHISLIPSRIVSPGLMKTLDTRGAPLPLIMRIEMGTDGDELSEEFDLDDEKYQGVQCRTHGGAGSSKPMDTRD